MEQMSLEALKAQEAILLRELEIENSEKNNLLQKHRQVLLNSAHLLRLYHQSSREASEIIKQTKSNDVNDQTSPEINEEEVISEILGKNGLRLLWDAFDNLELLRASLIFEYLKNRTCIMKSKILNLGSLNYFESQLTEEIIQVLTEEQTDGNFVSQTIKALNSTCSNQFVEYLKSELLKDSIIGSVKIINFYNNLKLSKQPTCGSIFLFVDQESNFCEYPQLRNIKSQVLQSVNISDLKENIKTVTSNFFTMNLNELPPIDPEILKGLELEDELVNNILNKVNELKLKGNTEKIRSELSDLFDKLMKTIQSTIRSNSPVVFDNLLKSKFSSIYETLEASNIPSEELETVFKSFDQIISNKSNIIFTIHRNELSALNSKREIPIPSKLYLASAICDNLLKMPNVTESDFLSLYVEKIKGKFYEMWLIDMKAAFDRLKEENNEIYALIWLSDAFLTLQISNEHKSDILISLDIENIKSKYFAQAALLTGLFEPEQISTPKLKNLNISEPTRELLPHFISL